VDRIAIESILLETDEPISVIELRYAARSLLQILRLDESTVRLIARARAR